MKELLPQISNYSKPKKVSVPDSLRGYNARVENADTKLSVSAIISYFYCPRCAYNQYVLHVPFEETTRSLRGQIQHVAYEWFLANEIDFAKICSQLSHEGALNKFHEKFVNLEFVLKRRFEDKCDTLGITFDNEIIEIKSIFEKKYDIHCKLISDLNKDAFINENALSSVFPRRRFEVYLKADDLGISGGRIDIIENNKPIEIKTGYVSGTTIRPIHLLQLVWYALILEYNENIDVDCAEIYYTKSEQRRTAIINAELRSWAIEVRNRSSVLLQKSKCKTNVGIVTAEPANINCHVPNHAASVVSSSSYNPTATTDITPISYPTHIPFCICGKNTKMSKKG